MMLMQSLASQVTTSVIESSEKNLCSVVATLFPSNPDANLNGRPPLYWYSTEARKLFAPNLSEEYSLFEHLNERVLKFDAALKSGNEFNNLLEPDLRRENLTSFETINIFVKVRCLKKATSLALELLGRHEFRKTWRDCCEMTCAWADSIGGPNIPKFSRKFRSGIFLSDEIITSQDITTEVESQSFPHFCSTIQKKRFRLRNLLRMGWMV